MQKAAGSAAAQTTRVVFSGIQPTGVPHLGNYAGALRQWVSLQSGTSPASTRAGSSSSSGGPSKLIYSIVDLHAITAPQQPAALARNRRECLAALLAVGLDPERCTLFYQSSVPAHSELMWILSCTASVGYLSRMTQWKQKLNVDQSSGLEDRPVGSRLKLGLFSYPVLQAADILIHRATHVPVGDDQRQHLEFARECATNFNAAYGPHLVHPETITPPTHRIMSLNDPASKMSKSHKSERSRILITDGPDDIRAKIRTALTDSLPGISYDPAARPGISNLLDVLSVFDARGRTAAELAGEHAGLSPKQFKDLVSDIVVGGLDGIAGRFRALLDDDDRLRVIETHGAEKARRSAQETMDIVKSAIGLATC